MELELADLDDVTVAQDEATLLDEPGRSPVAAKPDGTERRVKRLKRRDQRRMLFVFDHPGALRNFEAPIVEALERGHRVSLVFMSESDKDGAGDILERTVAAYPDLVQVKCVVKRDRAAGRIGQLRGVVDYLRYFDPGFEHAEALRARAGLGLGRKMRRLIQLSGAERIAPVRSLLGWALSTVCRVVPPLPQVLQQLQKLKPDVVVLSPLLSLRSLQYDYLKAAKRLGIPAVFAVHSWDNLTTKGRLQAPPDVVVVWNETQKDEAKTLHGVPEGRIVVTGAQCYDQWFGRRPSVDYASFCARLGLDPSFPTITYVASSPFIAGADEAAFARRVIESLRSGKGEKARSANILIRPHPQNADVWESFERGFDRVVVHPKGGANPIDPESKADYFDALHHAGAVVGLNTSAFIEACIVGRPAFTWRDPTVAAGQSGTLHFEHLVRLKGVVACDTLHEFAGGVEKALAKAVAGKDKRDFVTAFVRPHGLKRAATPLLLDALEAVAGAGRAESLSKYGAIE